MAGLNWPANVTTTVVTDLVLGASFTPALRYTPSWSERQRRFREAVHAHTRQTAIECKTAPVVYEEPDQRPPAEGREAIQPDDAGQREPYDVFLSYAGEDRPIAAELADALRGSGFNVWYDKFQLGIGDRLLERINDGLNNSRYGLLLISPAFLSKPWPKFEADALVRDWIGGQKVLLPIWHEVDEEMVREHQPGLAGVVALNTEEGIPTLAIELARAMVDAAGTVAFVPDYMQPIERFLRGMAELTSAPGHGGAFSIWEAILQLEDDDYPLWVAGRTFTRDDLLAQLGGVPTIAAENAVNYVGEDGVERIRAMLRARGFPEWDP
jgi:TIR domain